MEGATKLNRFSCHFISVWYGLWQSNNASKPAKHLGDNIASLPSNIIFKNLAALLHLFQKNETTYNQVLVTPTNP